MAFRRRKKRADGYTLYNQVKLIRGGKEYFSKLVEMIDRAEISIHFQTYIYDNDETGNLVAEALKRAAARGVRVKLLLDGYASQKLHGEFVENLIQAGVAFRWFEPIFKARKFYFGRRLHHKVVVTDNTYSLVGGVNISDKYNDVGEEPAWLDFALYTVGEASADLARVCINLWQKSNWYSRGKVIDPQIVACYLPETQCKVRVRRNDWVSRKHQVTAGYLHMIRSAKSHIIFVSSYFMPSQIFRYNIKQAIKRGVKVSIIVAGKSDVMLSKAAERYLYNWLFRYKVDIYEYKDGVLHGKASTCDGVWTTIGSYNINNISAYASIELNMEVEDEDFAKTVEHTFNTIMKDCCNKVVEEEYRVKTNYLVQLGHWMSYNIVRALFFLFTFYFKRNKEG